MKNILKTNFRSSYFSNNFCRLKKGFGVLEILLASSIFVLLLISVTGLLLYGRDSLDKDNLSSRASLLANEGMVAVENIRNKNFTELLEGAQGLIFSGGEWSFNGEYDETLGFKRVVTISTVSENEKKAVIEITWPKKNNRLGKITLSKYFTNWSKINLEPVTWWDQAWTCQQKIIIDNSLATQNFTDYQILLNFNTAELIAEGKIKNDCSDIRLVDSSGNIQLPQWIEPNTCNTAQTKIWTKVPFISNDSDNSIYLYYNNALADDVSSTTSVFVREIIDGLVLDFSMDEESGAILQDLSGHNNNGSIIGALREPGRFEQSLRFNGSNNYVNIPNSASLNMTTGLTIATWIKWNIDPSSGSSWASFVNKNVDNQYRLHHNSNNSKFEFAVRTSSGGRWVVSSVPPLQDVWQFVVGTYNGSNVKIYVDGQLNDQENYSGDLISSNSDLRIGNRSSNDRFFNGNIDKTQIYNKALSDEEILDLYNNYGYVTLNYPNNVLIKKDYNLEPVISFEAELCLPPESVLNYDINVTSDWDTAYCAEVTISTDSINPIIWQTDLLLDTFPINGIPSSVWEVNWTFSEPVLSVSGLAYNNEVSNGNPVTFGYCASRPEIIYPDQEVDYSIDITSDWNSGYCAKVTISTDSINPIIWQTDLLLDTAPVNGVPTSVSEASWTFSEPVLSVSGLSYNKQVSNGNPVAFTYCASR